MSDLLDEIEAENSLPKRYFGLSWKRFIIAIFIVALSGIYIGVILFGENSLQVLINLEEYQLYLDEEVKNLKSENAGLQKELFELEELDPDSK